MPEKLTQPGVMQRDRWKLEDFFIATGFYDLLPVAIEIAKDLDYDHDEMISAICRVNDKFYQYPPTKNRTAWFNKVFSEKLPEARADILACKAILQRTNNKEQEQTD